MNCIHYPLHFTCMHKRQSCLLLMCSNYVLNTILKQVVLVLMVMKYISPIIQIRIPNAIPDISSDTTSSSTSSRNFELMVNLSKHFLVTCKFEFLQIQPKGYGLGCLIVSRPNYLRKSLEIKLACDPISKSVSILVCLETTLIWKISILVSSS